jgi:hypothetical protein
MLPAEPAEPLVAPVPALVDIAAPPAEPVLPPLPAAGLTAPEPARGAELPPEPVVVPVVVLVVVLVGVGDVPAVAVVDVDVGGGALVPPAPNGAVPVPESPLLLLQAEIHNRPTNKNRFEITMIRAPHARARLLSRPPEGDNVRRGQLHSPSMPIAATRT